MPRSTCRFQSVSPRTWDATFDMPFPELVTADVARQRTRAHRKHASGSRCLSRASRGISVIADITHMPNLMSPRPKTQHTSRLSGAGDVLGDDSSLYNVCELNTRIVDAFESVHQGLLFAADIFLILFCLESIRSLFYIELYKMCIYYEAIF